jgi:hypothetical protein
LTVKMIFALSIMRSEYHWWCEILDCPRSAASRPGDAGNIFGERWADDRRRETNTKTSYDLSAGESVVIVSHVPLSFCLVRKGNKHEDMASTFSCPSSEAGIAGLRLLGIWHFSIL